MKRTRILVVGGGFTGLAAAYRLSADPALEVHLWEKSPDIGGLAGGFTLAGYPLEKAYHALFMSDREIVQLAEELGLGDTLIWRPAANGIYLDGRIHPFNSPFDLLRFSPVPWLDRLRTGFVALYLKYRSQPDSFEPHLAGQWMQRHCGAGAARAIWLPLLKGKFADQAGKVSMAWLWARLNIRARSRAKGGERFGYFRGGFQVIIDRLRDRITAQGGVIHLQRGVEKITPANPGFVITGETGAVENFDRVLFTASSKIFATLLEKTPQPPRAYIEQLRAVPYLAAVCFVFATRQALDAPFWLNINEQGAPFLVFTHHTEFVPSEFYGGLHVYYVGAYLAPSSELFQSPPGEIRRLWLDYVKRIFPMFDENAIVDERLFKLNDAQHVVTPGHSRRIPAHRTPFAGLYLANFSQIYPEDRGSNFAVRDGLKMAGMIRDDIAANL